MFRVYFFLIPSWCVLYPQGDIFLFEARADAIDFSLEFHHVLENHSGML